MRFQPRWSVGYAIGIRLLVVVVTLIATHFELGTHFDWPSYAIASRRLRRGREPMG